MTIDPSYRPPSAKCDLLATQSEAQPSEGAAEAASAKRLEDVEKIVRELRAEFDEELEYIEDILDRLMTRLETLESLEDPLGVVEIHLTGPSLD